MNFRNLNKPAFGFVEIVITIAIVGTLLTSIFMLQNTVFINVINQHERISRIFYIKNLFFEPSKEKNIKKEISDPVTQLSLQTNLPSEQSELKKFENIYILKTTGKWMGRKGEREETMITFVYEKPAKKKEE